MGFQPEGNVTRLPRERTAGEKLPYYRLITEGTGANEGKYYLADEGDIISGLTIPSEDGYRWDATNEAMVKRDGYEIGEYVEGIIEGIGFLELGETVSTKDLAIAGVNGVGNRADTALSALTAGEIAISVGRYIDSGEKDDIVRVKLNI